MQPAGADEELLQKISEQQILIEALQAQLEEARSLLRSEKISHIKAVCDFEVEEEKAANALLRRLDLLNKEKNKILEEMEKEEEFMANALIKKLEKAEKIKIEHELEQEEEFITNKLQAQMRALSEEKERLELKLEEQSPRLEYQISVLNASLSKMTESEKSLSAQIQELQYQNSFLTNRVKELENRLEAQSTNKENL